MAGAENGLEASGQLISMAIGQYKEVKGFDQTEIIDVQVYQHLARTKNSLVIGKIIDSQYGNPLSNFTVTAVMTGY